MGGAKRSQGNEKANDRKISHEEMRIPPGLHKYVDFYPGHLKYDYDYSIGQLKPDVVAQLWMTPQEAQPYLEDFEKVELQGGLTLYLCSESDKILWSKIETTE